MMPSLCQDVTSAGLLARQEQRPVVVRREERPGVMLSSDSGHKKVEDSSNKYGQSNSTPYVLV